MKRVRLNSLGQDDQIEIILAHPMAGKYVASLLENSPDAGALTAYAVVYEDETVCLRVPEGIGDDSRASHLLVWHGDTKKPWRVESKLLPRDAPELRLLVLAATTVSSSSRSPGRAA